MSQAVNQAAGEQPSDTQHSKRKKIPTHEVFITPNGADYHQWRNVGAGWTNEDDSVNVVFSQDILEGTWLQIRRKKEAVSP